MPRASSFTFVRYDVDTARSIISFTYRVEFQGGKVQTYTDRLFLKGVTPELWEKVPTSVLTPTLQALLLIIGINYWAVFPTRDIRIEGFALTREQARFWDALYLNGLGEFFYRMKMDFRDLIAFPYDASVTVPAPVHFARPARALLLNGAGKDSVLSAEMLKASGMPFDYFAFAPSPAHERIAALVGAKTISVTRRRDMRMEFTATLHKVSAAYPSVSTYTFIALLLAELLGYDSIIFSNERSADIGNLTYLGLSVNHQWCKSSEAEKLINEYIRNFITTDITTRSLLREYSELEIVRRFVQYPQYFRYVTSCNCYFWLSRPEQLLARKPYWCKDCPKCVFLFACFSAFLPKKEILKIFGANLYRKKHLLPLFRRILGIEGFKPLDCVGEPEEMALAMHYASRRKEYANDPVMRLFEEHFPPDYGFEEIERRVFVSMKPQEKKFIVASLVPIQKKIQELGLQKIKDEAATHYYGRHEGSDVTKFVVYPDRVVLRSLKEVDGKFEFGEDRILENKDEGFKWLKTHGFSTVDVVEMEYEEYAYRGGTIGLYVINSELYSAILFYPSDQHDEIEKEFGLNQAEVLSLPFNKYFEKIGKARFITIED